MNKACLRTDKTKIIDGQGRQVRLKGVNFGGWLMMEAYFVHAANLAQQVFEKQFARRLGNRALQELLAQFRGHFITEKDFQQVASWGMNCIRLPFHYKIASDDKTLCYLDQAVALAKKHKIYLLLDMHAAPGAQNPDWHSDSINRKTALWTQKSNRLKTYALWEKIADRYKDEAYVAGYDLLNEPVLDDPALLNSFYRETIKAIRRSDPNHILFIEGKHWAQQIDALEDFPDDNWLYSIHFYEPMEFAFHLIPFMRYPWPGCNKDVLRRRMEGYHRFAQKMQRPVHVGEFGVNFRQGVYNEHIYLRDELEIFNALGFHWNYWTYKAVKNFIFPDGTMSYYPNSPWVLRQGPHSGWDRWAELWPEYKKEMAASWLTKAFEPNTPIIEALKKAV